MSGDFGQTGQMQTVKLSLRTHFKSGYSQCFVFVPSMAQWFVASSTFLCSALTVECLWDFCQIGQMQTVKLSLRTHFKSGYSHCFVFVPSLAQW